MLNAPSSFIGSSPWFSKAIEQRQRRAQLPGADQSKIFQVFSSRLLHEHVHLGCLDAPGLPPHTRFRHF